MITQQTKYFFIDESGDPTLFKKGNKPVDLDKTSKFFMLGVAAFKVLGEAEEIKFENIRQDLLSNPDLKNVPSMAKTKITFHAKDDHPLVRAEVFRAISELDFSVNVIIRDKKVLIDEAQNKFKAEGKKLTEKEIYHVLVSKLFKRLLHKSASNELFFASRGKTFTTQSLKGAIYKGQSDFWASKGIVGHKNHNIKSMQPHEHIGLQIIDYALWALQRLFERKDDYFFDKISDKFSLIMDVDDKRHKPYGTWYNRTNRLLLEKMKDTS